MAHTLYLSQKLCTDVVAAGCVLPWPLVPDIALSTSTRLICVAPLPELIVPVLLDPVILPVLPPEPILPVLALVIPVTVFDEPMLPVKPGITVTGLTTGVGPETLEMLPLNDPELLKFCRPKLIRIFFHKKPPQFVAAFYQFLITINTKEFRY